MKIIAGFVREENRVPIVSVQKYLIINERSSTYAKAVVPRVEWFCWTLNCCNQNVQPKPVLKPIAFFFALRGGLLSKLSSRYQFSCKRCRPCQHKTSPLPAQQIRFRFARFHRLRCRPPNHDPPRPYRASPNHSTRVRVVSAGRSCTAGHAATTDGSTSRSGVWVAPSSSGNTAIWTVSSASNTVHPVMRIIVSANSISDRIGR
jgi:hypothetical protein